MRRALSLLAVAWLCLAATSVVSASPGAHRGASAVGVVTTLTVVEAEVRSEPLR